MIRSEERPIAVKESEFLETEDEENAAIERTVEHMNTINSFTEEVRKAGYNFKSMRGRKMMREKLSEYRNSFEAGNPAEEHSLNVAIAFYETILRSHSREDTRQYDHHEREYSWGKNIAIDDAQAQQEVIQAIFVNDENEELLDEIWKMVERLDPEGNHAQEWRRGILSPIAVIKYFRERGLEIGLPPAKIDAEDKIDLASLDGQVLIQVKTQASTYSVGEDRYSKVAERYSIDDDPAQIDDVQRREFVQGCQRFAKRNNIKNPVCIFFTIPHRESKGKKQLVDNSTGDMLDRLGKAIDSDLKSQGIKLT